MVLWVDGCVWGCVLFFLVAAARVVVVVASSSWWFWCFLGLLGGVWVLFVNSIACFCLCLFFVFELFGWDCLPGARLCVGWVFLLNVFCSESLILAQDERWRRA